MKINKFKNLIVFLICFLLFTSSGFISFASNLSDKLVLNKTVSTVDEEKGEYLLTLEAYGTEEVLNMQKIGMDIVLVLDRSGSMIQAPYLLSVNKEEMIEGEIYYDYNAENNPPKKIKSLAWNSSKSSWVISYYTGSNFGYATPLINPIKWDGNAWIKENLVETVVYYDKDEEGNLVETTTPSKSSTYDIVTSYEYTEVDFSSTTTFYETNMQATERSLYDFLESVYEHGEQNDVQHRIAIINYSDNKSSLYNGSNTYGSLDTSGISTITTTEYKSAFKNVDSDLDTIKKSIGVYSGNDLTKLTGNTTTHLGMQVAQNVLNNNPIETGAARKQMVLVFADGAPGNGMNYYVDWGNSALKTAQEIKDTSALIYTVGLYDQADANIDIENTSFNFNTNNKKERYYPVSNRLFNFISSNYKIEMQTDNSYYDYSAVTNHVGADGVLNYIPLSDDECFYGVQDSNALENAFENIAEKVDASAIVLDSSTILRDEIAKYFDLNCGCGENVAEHSCQINTYTADYNGTGFDERVAVTSADGIVATTNGRQIDVTGFSYYDNYIVEGIAGGKKLIVEVPIKVKNGFWGGNNVPTNESSSGIYYNGNTIESFPVPEANIEVLPEITSGDKTIYYGDDISPKDLNVEVTIDGYPVGIEEDGSMTPYEDWMDDYATLTWTDNSHDLETEIDNKIGGKYTFSVVVNPTEGNTGETNMSDNPSNIVGEPISVGTQMKTSISNVYILGYDGLIIEKQISNYDEGAFNDVEFSFKLYVKSIDVYFPELSETEFHLVPEGTEYTLEKADGTKTTETVGVDGSFKLKHNERAIFENYKRGSLYYVEEFDIDSETYDVVKIVSSEITDENGEIISSGDANDDDGIVSDGEDSVKSKELTIGVDSLVKFSNECAETNMRHLIIEKKVNGLKDSNDYSVKVTIGGDAYVGDYKVGDSYDDAIASEPQTTDDGIISLKQDQVAVILGNASSKDGKIGIPSETSFEVEEILNEEEYKEPLFNVKDGTASSVSSSDGFDGHASGKIKLDSDAWVTITNELLTSSLTITCKISDFNDELDKAVFWYRITSDKGYEKEIKIEFGQDETSSIGFSKNGKSITIDNLYPAKYTVQELPTAGYSLIKADIIGDANPDENSEKIPFSTKVTNGIEPSGMGKYYFWNNIKEVSETFSIKNEIRFDSNGDIKLSSTKNSY